jgi:hypothetical protein
MPAAFASARTCPSGPVVAWSGLTLSLRGLAWLSSSMVATGTRAPHTARRRSETTTTGHASCRATSSATEQSTPLCRRPVGVSFESGSTRIPMTRREGSLRGLSRDDAPDQEAYDGRAQGQTLPRPPKPIALPWRRSSAPTSSRTANSRRRPSARCSAVQLVSGIDTSASGRPASVLTRAGIAVFAPGRQKPGVGAGLLLGEAALVELDLAPGGHNPE